MDNRDFRKKLGFTNATNLKKFYKATDLKENNINWSLIESYNQRLYEISINLNNAIHNDIQIDIEKLKEKIECTYQNIKQYNLIANFNNNGRPYEDVYYNWMRGFLICEFFKKAICLAFNINENNFYCIGNDDTKNPKTFSKSATADIEIKLNNNKIRLEIQSGYTGKNDIKLSKINEAKNCRVETYIIHFDLFNGKVAIIDILNSNIETINKYAKENPLHEGTMEISIPQEAFCWDLTDKIQNYKTLTYCF